MTKQAPDPKTPKALGLTAEQRSKLLVVAEARLREMAAEQKCDLDDGDLREGLHTMIKLLLRYENIGAEIAKLPNVDSALKYALGHESQNAILILTMKKEAAKAATPAATPAPRAASFHLNLVLPQEWDHDLSEVGYRARSQGGRKITKTEILRALIRLLLQDLQPRMDLNQVKTEDDFLDRLRQAAKKL